VRLYLLTIKSATKIVMVRSIIWNNVVLNPIVLRIKLIRRHGDESRINTSKILIENELFFIFI